MSDATNLEAEMSSELEHTNEKPDEKAPAAEEKEVEQEEAHVYETLVFVKIGRGPRHGSRKLDF